MDIILIVIGFIAGWVARIIYKYYRNVGKLNRSKLAAQGYKPTCFEVVKDVLRNIVLRYNNDNSDFLVNISISQSTVIQLLHRSHFPELMEQNNDVSFGIAVYIPLRGLSKIQKEKLEIILKDHAETSTFSEIPFSYYVLDIGKKIRYGGELLGLIMKEVFGVVEEDQINIELYDEGKLPYNLIDFDSFRASL